MSQEAMIQLVELMGGDAAIINSARVSYAKNNHRGVNDPGERPELTDKDIGLLNRLLRDKHGTPFEHATMTFYVKTPIAVAREWFRHRIGSFNEVSGRYKVLPHEVYIPKQFRVPDPRKAQMDYKYKDAGPEINLKAIEILTEGYEHSRKVYEELLDLGIAKEQARLIMPLGQYTEFYWTVNARALMNFLELRTHPTAMMEIRRYATAIEHIWGQEMKVTHDAFVANGRIAP